MSPDDVTHAVLAERLSNLKEDVGDVRESMRYLQRTMVALVVSLLLMGAGSMLAAVLTTKG